VVVSLLGLLLIGLSFTTGLGIGAALIASIVVTSSHTLLPAVLGLVKVARATAASIDFTSFLGGRILLCFGVVLLLSFLLL